MAIPSNYTELQYIESTGNETIDLGIEPRLITTQSSGAGVKKGYKADLKMSWNSLPTSETNKTFIGCSATDGSTSLFALMFITRLSQSGCKIGYQWSSQLSAYWSDTLSQNIVPGEVYSVSSNYCIGDQEIVIKDSNDSTIIDYNTKKDSTTFNVNGITGANNATFHMFGTKVFGSTTSITKYSTPVKLYECKIYRIESNDNLTLIRDLVPVRNEDSGAIGLYDLIGEEFYGNISGTGGFIAGPNASPYEELEYIESNGINQYIDTGIRLNSLVISDSNKYKFDIEADMAYVENTHSNREYLWSATRTSSSAVKSVTGYGSGSNDNIVYIGATWGSDNLSENLSPSLSATNDRRIYGISRHGLNGQSVVTGDRWYVMSVLSDGTISELVSYKNFTKNTNAQLSAAGTGNILIFAQKTNANVVQYYSKARCYGFVITTSMPSGGEGDPLSPQRVVLNLVPVRNKKTGEVGLYDSSSDTFFKNSDSSGTNFTAGPTVTPVEDNSNCRIKVNGMWKKAILYKKSNGVWITGNLKIKNNGSWS